MNIVYIFTNFNNYQHTINVVNSIYAFTTSSPIIIVDNDSNEINVTKLNELEYSIPSLHIIYNEINLGYFKGLNIGIDYARNTFEFDLIVIGNNDLIFPKSFMEQVNLQIKNFDKYAVVSPNIITLDNVSQNPHVISKISNFRHFIYNLYFLNYSSAKFISFCVKISKNLFKRGDYTKSDESRVIYQGYGACYIIGPLFFKYYNQLFSPTFLMGEEFFLSYQLKMFDLNLFYDSSIVVFHQDHASTSLIDSYKFWKISKDSHKIYKKYLKSYE